MNDADTLGVGTVNPKNIEIMPEEEEPVFFANVMKEEVLSDVVQNIKTEKEEVLSDVVQNIKTESGNVIYCIENTSAIDEDKKEIEMAIICQRNLCNLPNIAPVITEKKPIMEECYMKLEAMDMCELIPKYAQEQDILLYSSQQEVVYQETLQNKKLNPSRRRKLQQKHSKNEQERNQHIHKYGQPEGTYFCEQCGKMFDQKVIMIAHSKTHTVDRPFSCLLCEKKFYRNMHLVKHVKTHSFVKPFKCDKCGKSFNEKSDLVRHMKIHTNERPFVCETCGKAFRQKAHLFTHSYTHSKQKPFLCEYCGKGYHEKGELTIHVRRHIGQHPYVCEYCGKGYAEKHALSVHVGIHVGRPFVCGTCGKGCNFKCQMVEHVKCHSTYSS